MPVDHDELRQPATPERLGRLVERGTLRGAEAQRAYALAARTPPADEWAKALSRVMLSLGALLVAAGALYFFAFNWAKLPVFAKFGLLVGAIVGAVGIAQLRTLRRRSGRAALLVAALLVGPLLAVYGQHYQTGADAYELFVAWALLTLPWVLVGRSVTLWGLGLLLADTSIVLFVEQVLYGARPDDGRSGTDLLAVAALHLAALLAAEYLLGRPRSWLTGRAAPRLVALVGLGALTLGACDWILTRSGGGATGTACMVAIPFAWAALIARYQVATRDLAMLALTGASIVATVTTAFGHVVLASSSLWNIDVLGVFLLALALIVEVGLVSTWLRAQARSARSG